MRDICIKMPCNNKIISVMEQYHMPEVVSVEQAEKIMLNKTIEQIVEEIGLIGTTYYLTEPCESVLYHSIARAMKNVADKFIARTNLGEIISADILSVREKALGYDRTKTIKISAQSGNVVCFIEAKTEKCEVPPKIKTGRTQGLKITSVASDRKTLSELFEDAGIKNTVIVSWLKDFYFSSINNHIANIKDMISGKLPDLEKIKQDTGQICKYAERLNFECGKIIDI